MKQFNNKKSFTIYEFIVAISIIVIMTGFFFFNYNAQKNKIDLNNATSAVVQEIRKAQSLTLAYIQPCSGVTPSVIGDNIGVHFSRNNNYVSLYVDQVVDTNPLNLTGDCTTPCKEESECIERKYFSPSIIIDSISINSDQETDAGWISFRKGDLAVKINGQDLLREIKVKLCVKANCTNEKKTITVNNKGMINVQ